MQLNPSEISELIKSRIQGLEASADVRNQGTVISVTDGIVRIHGLSEVMQGEMLEFPGNTVGLALDLEREFADDQLIGRPFGGVLQLFDLHGDFRHQLQAMVVHQHLHQILRLRVVLERRLDRSQQQFADLGAAYFRARGNRQHFGQTRNLCQLLHKSGPGGDVATLGNAE